ncbi:MAG: NUDIX domain-containing protein [Fimbriimonadaceae bacterium]|nr:NUDIX domain-containing protein [Fimbriimonadaceae bacterium]
MKRFPPAKYGRQSMQFYPAPYRAPLRAFAALVFAWKDETVLICDIIERGWSIPSGRVEPNESSREAAIREAKEEAGAIIDNLQYIGCYEIKERGEVRWADCYAATVDALVEIGAVAESRARQFVEIEQLPDVYHWWNELSLQVFQHSKAIIDRLNRTEA